MVGLLAKWLDGGQIAQDDMRHNKRVARVLYLSSVFLLILSALLSPFVPHIISLGFDQQLEL